MSKTDIESRLQLLTPKVRDNVTIVTPEDIGSPFLLHVSKKPNIKRFTPFIGFRQANMEDRTLPRVTTSVQLLGCLIGYAMSEIEFIEGQRSSKENSSFLFDKNDYFRGGLYIYGIPFEYALRPNNKLVYDASMSNEHWLINYRRDQVDYPAEVIGKLFYTKIILSASENRPEESMEMYIEVDRDISFTDKKVLTKGYWKIEGPSPRQTKNFKTTKPFKFTEISKSEFYSFKNENVALLSHQQQMYRDW